VHGQSYFERWGGGWWGGGGGGRLTRQAPRPRTARRLVVSHFGLSQPVNRSVKFFGRGVEGAIHVQQDGTRIRRENP